MVEKQEQIAGMVRQRLVLRKCRSISKSVGVTVEGQMRCQNGEAWRPDGGRLDSENEIMKAEFSFDWKKK